MIQRSLGLIQGMAINHALIEDMKNKLRSYKPVVKKLNILIMVIGLGLIGCHKKSSKFNHCRDNLYQIQAYKEMWANESAKTKTDVPSWRDIQPFFPAHWSNGIPICPEGGRYSINRVGETPTCSIGGPRFRSRLELYSTPLQSSPRTGTQIPIRWPAWRCTIARSRIPPRPAW